MNIAGLSGYTALKEELAQWLPEGAVAEGVNGILTQAANILKGMRELHEADVERLKEEAPKELHEAPAAPQAEARQVRAKKH